MSHPSDTPHSSHVESRSRKALRSYIIQAATLLEIVLSGLVLIGLLLSFIPLLKWMPGLLFDGNDVEIRTFLERALDIVIGIEFIKMLAKHSPGSSLEVLLYAIARHMVIGHDSAFENLLRVTAISLFFDQFTSLTVVAHAFQGIQVCVIYLIFSAGVRMLKALERTPLNVGILLVVMACMIAFSLLAVKFSSIAFILLSGMVGVAVWWTGRNQKGGR